MLNSTRRLLGNESGGTAVEYAIVAMLVGLTLVFVLETMGGTLRGGFDDMANDTAAATAKH